MKLSVGVRIAALFVLPFIVSHCSLSTYRPMMTIRLRAGGPGVRTGRSPSYPKCVLFTLTSPTTSDSVSSAETGGLSPSCLRLKGIVSPVVTAEEAKSTGVQFAIPSGQYDITPIGVETTGSCTSISSLFANGPAAVYLLGEARSISSSQTEVSVASNYNSTTAQSLTDACNSGGTANALGAGGYQTCAALGGSLKCWGANGEGQLGNGTTADISRPRQVVGLTSGVTAVATGAFAGHSCAIVEGGLKCWGGNAVGQLGDGTNTNSLFPTQVLGMNSNVTDITVGSYNGHTCAVQSGALKCWGENSLGQLGNNTTNNENAPHPVFGLSSGVTSVMSGTLYGHTCGLRNGQAFCWGSNSGGQLGDGTLSSHYLPNAVTNLVTGVMSLAKGSGGATGCALMMGGTVLCWGDMQTTPLGVAGLLSGVTALAIGSGSFACAIQNGAAVCWGQNGFGQLGDSSTTTSVVPVQVTGMGSGVTAIACGSEHACAVKDDALYCWGRNHRGQLGNNTTTDSLFPVLVSLSSR